jgi:hypothetical protein
MKRYFLTCCMLFLVRISYAQIFSDTNLPIIIINTDGGATITDDPRVFGEMKIIYRGPGQRNYLTDQNNPAFLNYKGRISIEIRGSSSQVLPKKQYGFSTLSDDNSAEANVSLLGMPADNDWILNGLGFEPSFMRDYLCYNLARKMGWYSSRTAYCEVVLNGSYNGLYVLEEKIKRGSDRVNITKLDPLENTYPKVTGGYIVKADKTGGDPVAFTMSSYYGTNDISYIMHDPKPEDVTPVQVKYIESEFTKLASLSRSSNSSIYNGYPTVIDISSFVDYILINELGSNADAYTYSTFFHKDRNGKLRAGPLWDLNLTFGYDLAIWGYDRSKPDVWQFSTGDNDGARFWRDLFENPQFRCSMYKRWTELTQPGQVLNYNSLVTMIDQTYATIKEATGRDYWTWGTVPDPEMEATKIKTFLSARIPWMNNAMKPTATCSTTVIPPLVITKIMYHPDSTAAYPVPDDLEFIEIKNIGTTSVDLTGLYFGGTGLVYQFPAYSVMQPNTAKIIASDLKTFKEKYGQIPFGQFTRHLSDKQEKLVLADAFGNVIDSLTYSDHSPWPDADGNGLYLALSDPSSDNSVAVNWTASSNIVLSAPETEYDNGFVIYPLPVSDFATIENGMIIESFELYDFQGRMIRSTVVNAQSYRLDMSAFSPGIYILQVKTVTGNYTRKIVKQ